MKIDELYTFVRDFIQKSNKIGYQNVLNQFRNTLSQIRALVKQQPQNPQTVQQLNQLRQQFQASKEGLSVALFNIGNEVENIKDLPIAKQLNIEKFFSPTLINIARNASEGMSEGDFNEINQIFTQYNNLAQLNNILTSLQIAVENKQEDLDRLNILFDGGAMIETLKDLTKEAANWNQHIHCFSLLGRETDTDAKIASIEKGSLLLVIATVSGTVIAVMKAVDKILDTITKIFEVQKKTLELKQLKLVNLNAAIDLLEKSSKLHTLNEAEDITNFLLKEYEWTESDLLYNETKNATKTAVKKIIRFINKGGKVDGHIKQLAESGQKELFSHVKAKNEKIKEIEKEIKALSNAKTILMLEDENKEDEGD